MNWESTGLGIIAFATVLAVAIAAGIFASKELEAGLPVPDYCTSNVLGDN